MSLIVSGFGTPAVMAHHAQHNEEGDNASVVPLTQERALMLLQAVHVEGVRRTDDLYKQFDWLQGTSRQAFDMVMAEIHSRSQQNSQLSADQLMELWGRCDISYRETAGALAANAQRIAAAQDRIVTIEGNQQQLHSALVQMEGELKAKVDATKAELKKKVDGHMVEQEGSLISRASVYIDQQVDSKMEELKKQAKEEADARAKLLAKQLRAEMAKHRPDGGDDKVAIMTRSRNAYGKGNVATSVA